MRTVDLIQRKRAAEELSPEEITFLVNGYTSGEIPDYQMSAFLMATCFTGMTDREVSALTESMMHSGGMIDLSGIAGMKVDKHSTGGVGDKTSLISAPIAAAAGVIVPMMSGRALGHTGGTLDQLESIPGFSTDLTMEQFQAQLAEHGLAFIGQTDEVAPADKKLYALRDVTGDRGIHPADRVVDHVEEAGGRHGRAGSGCEGRGRGLHEEAGGCAAAGRDDGRDRPAHG